MTQPLRPPAVAGQFYAEDPKELASQLEACFLDAHGPGHLPPRHRSASRSIRAAVVPHAGYQYSGPTAAHVYAALASDHPPASTLILGVDHHGRAQAPALSDQDWSVPLGPVTTEHELVRALTQPPVVVDDAAHRDEHSIEVQLPFLQYVLPEPRIVALMVPFGSLERLTEVAAVVREVVTGRDVLLLASTDFSHYVPAATAQRLDALAIDPILRIDPAGLYDTVQRHRISMCGIAPTTVLLSVLHGAPVNSRLLRWGHSGEAEPMETVVGYAGIVFETGAAG